MNGTGFDFNPKEKQSLSSKVYQYIRDGIIDGRYRTGEYLVETKLAEELGISRTPIREALKQLEQEELVVSIPNRGAQVRGLTEQDTEDMFAIRLILEGQAAYWAATRIMKEDLDRLEELVDLMELYTRRKDVSSLTALDSDFHDTIYSASKSRTLKHVLTALHQNLSHVRKSSLTLPDRSERSLAEHREILSAISGHQPELAKTCMENHIRNAKDAGISSEAANEQH